MLLLQSDVLHQIIRPLHAREEDRVRTVLKLLDDGIREIRLLTIVLTHLVVEGGIIVRACLLDHLCRRQGRERNIERNLRLTLSTALGRDEHNTICTTHTKHSSGRGIFQHRHTLNLVRIDIPHLTFYTVYLNQR